MDHKNVPNIVLLSHRLEQLYSCIFARQIKVFFCLLPFRVCIDAYVMIRIHVFNLSCVCPLINYTLATEEYVHKYESAHVAMTSHLLEMSSITTPNQKQFRIVAQGTLFKVFFRENIGDFTDLHNEIISLEVMCKRNRFGYWNSCKRLPNFINVAALL